MIHAPLAGWFAVCIHVLIAGVVSGHIILTKEDVRAAIGWTGLVWLAPVVGSILYVLFGINRISRRAGRMRRRQLLGRTVGRLPSRKRSRPPEPAVLPARIPQSVYPIATLVGTVTGSPLAQDCAIEPLVDGDSAYPSMLRAIEDARHSIAMASYIFDRGVVGQQFVDALARAVERGVEVRVLIDGVGEKYSRPPITWELRARRVPVASFLTPLIPIPNPYFNLRNHRKLLIVDGTIGFCGGMNIRDACLLSLNRSDATRDVHFRVQGPVVQQLMTTFAFDWRFTTKEQLSGERWWPPLAPAGGIAARGIPDGPDEDYETLLMTILGAIAQAAHTIRLATPYFLPDPPLVAALRVAALRGVRVEIILPERGNLRLVQWAMTAQLPQVIAWGCKVYLTPRPFDHSKLLVVDKVWSLIGSANWDPRSLRLNFEYGLECYSAEFGTQLDNILENRIATSHQLTLEELDRRPIPRRLRDGCARLAQPYL